MLINHIVEIATSFVLFSFGIMILLCAAIFIKKVFFDK